MSIDKYLWAIRFYKSRNEASNACKKGHIRIDEVTVKPSREVFGAEKILIRKNQMEFTLLVIGIPKSRVGPKLVEQYAKDLTPEDVRKARIEVAINQAKNKFEISGRPSKKNRRDLTKVTKYTWKYTCDKCNENCKSSNNFKRVLEFKCSLFFRIF